MLTLADHIESNWIYDLTVMRNNGWMVAVHNDYVQSGMRMTFWLFTHPSGQWVKGEGSSDGIAVYQAFCQTRLGAPSSDSNCLRCRGGLQPYSNGSGLACYRCMIYLEKDRWWSIYCDEAHQHSYHCLVQVE